MARRRRTVEEIRAGAPRKWGDPTDTVGGSAVRYWPTFKAFEALGLPAPDHPRYREAATDG